MTMETIIAILLVLAVLTLASIASALHGLVAAVREASASRPVQWEGVAYGTRTLDHVHPDVERWGMVQ